MEIRAVLELVEAAIRDHDPVLIGIGGYGAAGKTTLARALPAAQIVATDAFWDGAGFDLARLRAEALDPILAGREARFAAWDWAAGRPAGVQVVEPRGVIAVEGVCALHRMFRDDYHVRVWVAAPAETRLERGVQRDGEDARATWVDVWMPRELRYVDTDRPVECAHLVVDGTGRPPAPWEPPRG